MVKYSGSLDTTFGALADPTRRAILSTLFDSLERYLADEKAKEDQKWQRRNRNRESRSN